MNKFLVSLFILLLGSLSFSLEADENPVVLIKTDFGNIKVEIFAEQAPITATNFLRYVDAGMFKGASFYRVVRLDNQPNNSVKIEVIQGGLEFSEAKKPYPPILHETTDKTGILHQVRPTRNSSSASVTSRNSISGESATRTDRVSPPSAGSSKARTLSGKSSSSRMKDRS